MKKLMRKQLVRFAMLLSMAVFTVLMPVSLQAASKPSIVGSSAYLDGKVYLRWSKVSGARKYEIQRAMVSPSSGKIGGWRRWKTVKKTSVTAAAAGDYKYRIRALKGGSVSEWSNARRIFAANAKIIGMEYTEPLTLFGVNFTEGYITFGAQITNRTKSPMGFVPSGTRFKKQHTVYALNRDSGAVMHKWKGDLDVGSGIAKQVSAGKSQVIYVEADVTQEEWDQFRDCKFMISSSFYPNPTKEPLSTQMAIAYTADPADSSVAVK